jgi:hypothetical protein
VPKPEPEKLTAAAADLAAKFDPTDVSVYLGTLVSQDPETWGGLVDLPQLAGPAS